MLDAPSKVLAFDLSGKQQTLNLSVRGCKCRSFLKARSFVKNLDSRSHF